MPNTGQPLPIFCPKCHLRGCRLIVKSLTIMTVTCASCGHTWAAEINELPFEIQERVRATTVET